MPLQITIDKILSLFKNTTVQKSAAQIKNELLASLTPENELFSADDVNIREQVDEILKTERKKGDSSELKYTTKGKYQKRKHRLPPDITPDCNTQYLGTAGEYAVMSELLFKGYNVNRMVIDDGIDVIASKNNKYYYIQVKTTTATAGRNPHWQVPLNNYLSFLGSQEMRYIFVLRHGTKDGDRNIFYIMTPRDLDHEISKGTISKSDNNINLKIKFDGITGEPILYDKKESSALYYQNNFNL